MEHKMKKKEPKSSSGLISNKLFPSSQLIENNLSNPLIELQHCIGNHVVQRMIIQRECRDFEEGWKKDKETGKPLLGKNGKPADKGTFCETLEEAQNQIYWACPSECFIYQDGPETHPYRPIPGNPCAHYVAHELGIQIGEKYNRCLEGYSVCISQITTGTGRTNIKNLGEAQVNDIWVSATGEHSGVVIRVYAEKKSVKIKQCNLFGEVKSYWTKTGSTWR